MATFFGEVLSVFSRAVEEEDDSDDMTAEDEEIRRELEEKRSVRLHWLSQTESPQPCSDMLIAVGPSATGFISAFVLGSGSWTAVGWMSIWNERSRGWNRSDADLSPDNKGCVVYQQEQRPSVLVCQCKCFVAEDQLFQWTQELMGRVQARSVTVLSDCSLSEYKTSDYLIGNSAPFLRVLKTDVFTGSISAPLLEQPNISTGLAAAVLSHCQVHQIPAVLYLCYSDVPHPDSVTMEKYKDAVKGLQLNLSPSAEVLLKITRSREVQSNLYT